MLFDIRGRRKHVVRVVYAILALLMGASLFLVVGPFNIGNLVNTGSTTNSSQVLDEQAERIERKLHAEPDNEALLAALTRTRISAGNALTEVNPETGAKVAAPEAQQEFAQAAATWQRYLKQATSPSAPVAAIMAGAYFTLAETSPAFEEAEKYVAEAAAAQTVAAEAQPTVNSLTTLAIYAYYAGDFKTGNEAAKKAEAKAPKAEAKEVKKRMGEYRARGKAFEKQKQEFAKQQMEQGKESLQNPFGGLGGSTGSLGG
jgi:chaperonin cofactor prefoldin